MKRSTFFIFCLEGAILSFNVAATAAIVPSIADTFALSQFFAGNIIWLYMLPYGVAALIYGPLVRAIDAKKVEVACLFLFSLANLLAALSKNIYTLFAARFLMGLFGASVIPLGLILIAKHIEAKKRGRFVGIFFGATFVASLAGLILSGIIQWRYIFLIPAVCGLILTAVMIFFLPSFEEDVSGFRVSYIPALRSKKVVTIFTYIFFASLFYHGVQQWLGVYFSRTFNLSQFLISSLITLTSLSGIFGEVIGGLLSDIIGRIKTVNFGIILMVLSVFALLFKLPLALLAAVMIVWGLGWTLNHAGLCTMLTDLPKDFLNEAASLNSGVRFLSGGLGVAIGGLLMQRSFNLGFIVFGVCLLGLLFFSKLLRDTL